MEEIVLWVVKEMDKAYYGGNETTAMNAICVPWIYIHPEEWRRFYL